MEMSNPAAAPTERSVVRRTATNLGVALRDIVVVILILAATFDGLSGNWVHGILLYATAIALGRDAVRRRAIGSTDQPGRPEPYPIEDDVRTRARRLVFVPVAVFGVVAYAAIVGGFARYSWPATVSIVIPSAFVLWLTWREPARRRPAP